MGLMSEYDKEMEKRKKVYIVYEEDNDGSYCDIVQVFMRKDFFKKMGLMD